jgi:hypothetical protein
MNLDKRITIVIAVVLFGGDTVVAGQQALAFFDGHGHSGTYGLLWSLYNKRFFKQWCPNRLRKGPSKYDSHCVQNTLCAHSHFENLKCRLPSTIYNTLRR